MNHPQGQLLSLGSKIHLRQQLAGAFDVFTKCDGILGQRGYQPMRVLAEGAHAMVYFQPLFGILKAIHQDSQTKAILDLGSQCPLLWVHRSYQGKARSIDSAQGTSSYRHPTLSSRVEDGIDDNVVEQVDLVDIEQISVRVSQNAPFQSNLLLLDSHSLIDPADHVFQSGIQGQFDEPHAIQAC